MKKTSSHLVEKCRQLRQQDIPLGEIMKKTGLPKTTVYKHICNIPRSSSFKRKISKKVTEKLVKFNKSRKGKSALNRHPIKFKKWTPQLIMLVGHFIFDGEINNNGCVYSNRSEALIQRVEKLAKLVYKYPPKKIRVEKSNVIRISYHNVELAAFIKNKSRELLQYIQISPKKYKRQFLKSFFDDEGCINIYQNNRRVRGYQHDIKILKLIQNLLLDFNIKSVIENKQRELVIRRKENLKKFQKEINFSKGIYINPNRKNSVWKKKLEKRKILEKAIKSYQNLNRVY